MIYIFCFYWNILLTSSACIKLDRTSNFNEFINLYLDKTKSFKLKNADVNCIEHVSMFCCWHSRLTSLFCASRTSLLSSSRLRLIRSRLLFSIIGLDHYRKKNKKDGRDINSSQLNDIRNRTAHKLSSRHYDQHALSKILR